MFFAQKKKQPGVLVLLRFLTRIVSLEPFVVQCSIPPDPHVITRSTSHSCLAPLTPSTLALISRTSSLHQLDLGGHSTALRSLSGRMRRSGQRAHLRVFGATLGMLVAPWHFGDMETFFTVFITSMHSANVSVARLAHVFFFIRIVTNLLLLP